MGTLWFRPDTPEYQKIHDWLLANERSNATKIGKSKAGNLKFMHDGNVLTVIPLISLPASLAATVQNMVGGLLENPSAKEVNHLAEQFAVQEPYAQQLGAYWDELCKKANIHSVSRRTQMKPRLSHNDFPYTSLEDVCLKKTDARPDGNYMDLWKSIYEQDIKRLCKVINDKRLLDTTVAVRTAYLNDIFDALADTIQSQYHTRLLDAKCGKYKEHCTPLDNFGFTCTVNIDGIANGTIVGEASGKGYCTPIVDGKQTGKYPKSSDEIYQQHVFEFGFQKINKKSALDKYKLTDQSQFNLTEEYKKKLSESLSKIISPFGRLAQRPYICNVSDIAAVDHIKKTSKVRYDTKQNRICVDCSIGTLAVNPETHEFELIEKSNLLQKIDRIPDFQQRVAACEKIDHEYNQKKPDEIHKMRLVAANGPGMVLGDTDLTFACDTQNYTSHFYLLDSCDIGSFTEAVEREYQNAFQAFANLFAQQVAKEKKKKQELYDLVSSDPLRYSILYFVNANSKYITATAVQQALRGNTVQLNTFIKYTPECGQFGMLAGKEIEDEVNLMVKKGLLFTRSMRGTYGRFDVLKMTQVGKESLGETKKAYERITTMPSDWWTTPYAFSLFLNSIQNNTKSQEKMRPKLIELLHHLDNRHMIAYFHDDIVDAFPKADEEMMKFIRMYRSMQPKDSWEWDMLGHILRGKHLQDKR